MAKVRACDSQAVDFCETSFQVASFRLDLTASGNALQGRLTVVPNGVDVVGSVASDGTVTLTGTGQGIRQTVTLAQWQTRVDGATMTGGFAFDVRTSAGDSGRIGISLERVFKAGSAEAAAPLPPDVRFAVRVLRAGAVRLAPPFARTEYSPCFIIDNAAPTRATMTFLVTPVGPDGRAYALPQPTLAGGSVNPATQVSGCTGAVIDPDYRRAVAPTYRLRVDFSYDDGVTGSGEGTAPVRVTYDSVQ